MNEDRKYKIYAGARGSGKSLFSPDYFEDEELEALKCLEELEQDIKNRVILAEDRQLKLCAVIKATLLKTEKLEQAWEIVKEKDVDLRDLKAYFKTERGLQEYNKHQYKENELTQEEFDLLKEML